MQHPVASLGMLLGYMAGVLIFSVLPGADETSGFLRWNVSGPVASTLHFFVYAGLAGLWTQYLSARSLPYRRAALCAIGISVAYGLLNELLQVYVPGRSASVGDGLFNMLGGISGAWLAAWFPGRR